MTLDNKKISEELTIAASHFSEEREYWLGKLAGDIVKSCFPYDYDVDKNSKLKRDVESITFTFFKDLCSKVIKASSGSEPRLFIILTVGLVHLLRLFSGNDDIIIGIPISKQAVKGKLINTVLPIRTRFDSDSDMTFRKLLMQLRQTVIEAGENQNYPVDILPNELDMTASENGDFPLFDVIVLLENIHDKSYIQHIAANLVFSFKREGEEIRGVVEYNLLKYAKETVDRISSYLMSNLYEVLVKPDIKLSAIDILSEEEKRQFLVDFNKTDADYPKDKTIRELFGKQAARTPERTAVICGESQVSYKELNESANKLAQVLRRKGVKDNAILGIMGHRSIEMIVVILGIFYAGGAYLPINAQDPIQRIKYILKDSKANLLLTDNHALIRNNEIVDRDYGDKVIIIEDLISISNRYKDMYPDPAAEAHSEIHARPESIAYVIYTSGTTGKPKGVIVEQRSLVNYVFWAAKTYVKNEPVNFPFYTSFSFDMSITSIFTPLISGNAIVIYGGDDREFILEKVIADNRVGVVKVTPSHLKMIRNRKIERSSIKRFIVGGEELETQLTMEIMENFNGDIEIYNEYGPTEAAVGCMIYKYNPGTATRHSVPIGVPADNTQVYLLDTQQRPVPIGVIGELYISGDGLARGYLHNPGLTAERFVNNPFIPGKKMYKTGDLVRRLPDGTFEFLGRKDSQVKIRGFRIELGEIENHLREYDGIKEAIVLTKKDKNNNIYLCAYFISTGELILSGLREYLIKKLPDYMIPQFFMEIEQIPLTTGGKLDTKALPKPVIKSEEKYVAPRTDREIKLVKIWSEILGVENAAIGINNNFFELGGHSLSATGLVMKVLKEFNVKLPLEEIFKLPTVKGISSVIEANEWVSETKVEFNQEREEIVI